MHVYLCTKGIFCFVIHPILSSSRVPAIAVIAILVSLAFLGTGELAPTTASAETSRALAIMSQAVDIDYGEKISISVTIDVGSSAKEIDNVRALFRPHGGSTIWSYSYPQYSLPKNDGSEVLVEFDIPTGPGSYYPPGTEFDIEIEVTDLDGKTSSIISPDSIEYLDPANEWERVKGDGYTVVYYGVDRARVEELVATVDHRIPTLEATLGVTDPPNFKAIVFPSIQAATPSFPPVSQTATDSYLFAGFAQPEYRLFVQGQMNSTTFTHELAHLYSHEAISSSFTGVPSWLGEGLSRFLESGSSESSNDRLRSSVRPDELLSLNHMQTIPGQRSDVFIFYPQAGAFVGYLIEEYSHATMADFLDQMNKGRTLEDAFELIYDKPLYEIENDWRALFNADPLPAPFATVVPGDISGAQVPNTPVPLVDYEAAAAASSDRQPDSTSTITPASLPTVTPENPQVFNPADFEEKNDPDWLVAGLIIGLSVVTGVWLFTSRRRMPKRKT
jgi:hypothetical protein